MRAETINAQDIWNASNLKESKKLLRRLSKEIKKIKEWHMHAQRAENLKAKIANDEIDFKIWDFQMNFQDLLAHHEAYRDRLEAENKDGMIR